MNAHNAHAKPNRTFVRWTKAGFPGKKTHVETGTESTIET
jgi:hypothetical protein